MKVTREGMGSTFTRSARRTQIVGATIDTLADLGYARASYAKIAERAGLSSTRLISYHFADKADLMAEVVRTVFAAGASYVTPRVRAQQTAPDRLAACLRANIEFLITHARGIAAVHEIVANLPDTTGRGARGPRDELILEGIEAILRQGQADGDFCDFDTRTAAWAIRNTLDGVHQRHSVEPDFDAESCIRELTALFNRALTVQGRT